MAKRIDVCMIVSLKAGLAPFTRRDVAAMVADGMTVLLVPAKVGAGVDTATLPAPVAPYSAGRRVTGVLAGKVRALAHPRRFLSVVASAARHGEWGALLLALQALSACPSPRLVYAVFGDRKLFTGYYLSILSGAPLAVTLHAYELYDNPRPALLREALAHAAEVMTVTEVNRELLSERWGVARERVEVVRVSADAELFTPARPMKVLIVGSWTDRKGHLDALDALSRLERGSVELWVVGGPTGVNAVDVRAEARARNVEDACVFFGQIEEGAVAALMRAADVLLQPSRVDASGALEGFPTAVAEAMFSGLPVIVTDHAEMPRIVPSKVVPERSPQALADVLAEYRDHPDMRTADGARNRCIAEAEFGPAAHQRLIAVLRRAIADD